MQCRISCGANHAIKIVWPYLVPPDCVQADMRKRQWMTTTTIKLDLFYAFIILLSQKSYVVMERNIFWIPQNLDRGVDRL